MHRVSFPVGIPVAREIPLGSRIKSSVTKAPARVNKPLTEPGENHPRSWARRRRWSHTGRGVAAERVTAKPMNINQQTRRAGGESGTKGRKLCRLRRRFHRANCYSDRQLKGLPLDCRPREKKIENIFQMYFNFFKQLDLICTLTIKTMVETKGMLEEWSSISDDFHFKFIFCW